MYKREKKPWERAARTTKKLENQNEEEQEGWRARDRVGNDNAHLMFFHYRFYNNSLV